MHCVYLMLLAIFRTRSRELYRETRGTSPRSGESRKTFEKRDVCYCTMMYITVLWCMLLYYYVCYCTVMYVTVPLYSNVHVRYCTVMYITVLWCMLLYCDVRYCTMSSVQCILQTVYNRSCESFKKLRDIWNMARKKRKQHNLSAEMRLIRWICYVKLKDQETDLQRFLGIFLRIS